jgi:muramoyltetrapeptide carboxypeptidase
MSTIVEIVATGSNNTPEHLTQTRLYLEEHGFAPRISPHIFGEHPLYVNHDHARLENFLESLDRGDSTLIWFLRGGSGTLPLIPEILAHGPSKDPKILVGFSDITSLLLVAAQQWGWPALHAPTAYFTAAGKVDPVLAQHIIDILQGRCRHLTLEGLHPLNAQARGLDGVEAPLIGGNLSVLEYSLGTPWQLKAEGNFLFLEDINEPPYRLAARLEHFRQCGIFEGVKAVLFGDFRCLDPDPTFAGLWEFVMTDFSRKIGVPCFSGLPVGHMAQCHPVWVGRPATLDPKQGTLSQHW